MRTSGILKFGGAIVALLGGSFTLLMLKAFLLDKGQGFVDLTGLMFGVVALCAGLAGVAAGGRRARLEKESDARAFAEVVLALAKRGGGKVAIDALCKATGIPSDEAQSKMRALTGEGLFDLDFDGNGKMIYKQLEAAPSADQRSGS
jgi:hypothetical protein